MVDDKRQGGEELKHETPKPKSPIAAREEEILAFWNKEDIFKQSLEKPAPRGEYTFYDGPPFANGLPHYGHILASTIKDAIPRYQTMRGYHVQRKWGWDCHGLPVENLVEKELGFKGKKDIIDYGIAKFNAAARKSIMKDVADWKRIIPRLGRWADMDNDYKTMDASYTESVWWSFKTLFDKGLIYEGFKSMHLCPRCGTTLSNFEVAQGYQDIQDFAVTVKLPLIDEPDTSLLIWTTTPWTLPGNVAAAVNKDATYVKVKVEGGFVILGKERVAAVVGDTAEVVVEMKGKDLVGKRYEPPFAYFKDQLHKHKTHAWKVYAAPYVTLNDGTGIVHLAPAYGAEDLQLAQQEKIPLIHHVTEDGKFIATVADFAGLSVKPKGRHMETDEKIVEALKVAGLLFAVEKITHSYPHCWRCDTPLLNWAANSWFVNVQALKKKLSSENKKISWVPEHVGKGRFQNGIESAPDWAISRSRFWGAPLPVWRNKKTKEVKVIGSVDELLTNVHRSGNRYFLMRHGQAVSNTEGRFDSSGRPDNHLTDEGRASVRAVAEDIRKLDNIDIIIMSPFLRTRETVEIVQQTLGLPDHAVMVDERLRETGAGMYDGKLIIEWMNEFSSPEEYFTKKVDGGETFTDIRRRVGSLLFEVEQRYAGKNILFVTHGGPAWLMHDVAKRCPIKGCTDEQIKGSFIHTAEVKEFSFVPFPHNDDFELDLHRPFIDDIKLGNMMTGEWERIPDVFDCWYESGSMPFASNHYPFRKDDFNPKKLFGLSPRGYPADFIAEGLDQTRGWFYSLIVLGTSLFGKSPYKHVIVNGLVLAQDGQKMSKRLRNYPDPMEVVETYGADALRYYLLSSSVIRAEDLRFKAAGVEEVSKKLLTRLDNVRSFYELYAPTEYHASPGFKLPPSFPSSKHLLDRWVLSRLGELIRDTTAGFESYELDVAVRPLGNFIDDLSTWYLRRSRDRLKGEEKNDALETLRYVLYIVAHIMAPVMPFFADDLYRRMRGKESGPESVHLSSWPNASSFDVQLVQDMERVRAIASIGLQVREKASIKVRQPLARLAAKNVPTDTQLRDLLADEVNVKEVVEDASLADDEVLLDTTLTAELQEEGLIRGFVRQIQAWRKEQNLTISDRPEFTLTVSAEEKPVVEKHREEIKKETGLKELYISEQ